MTQKHCCGTEAPIWLVQAPRVSWKNTTFERWLLSNYWALEDTQHMTHGSKVLLWPEITIIPSNKKSKVAGSGQHKICLKWSENGTNQSKLIPALLRFGNPVKRSQMDIKVGATVSTGPIRTQLWKPPGPYLGLIHWWFLQVNFIRMKAIHPIQETTVLYQE